MNYIRNVLIFLLTIVHFIIYAQDKDDNLVPNYSFEEHVAGINPYGSSKGRVATHWYSPTGGTPDFFIKWSYREGDMDNWPGFKLSRTGDCYYGLMTRYVFTYSNSDNSREYISTKLKRPLVRNQKYEVSFYVQLAQNCKYATNGLGIYISHQKIDTADYKGILNFEPQIKVDEVLKNTMRWKKITDTFESKGGEQFITIGNFNTNEKTDWEEIEKVGKYNIYYFSYYFIDDIIVKPLNYYENDLIPGQSNILANLMFKNGEAELLSGSLEELSKLLKLMTEYPRLIIEIVGHTDNIGKETDNQKLSYDRAKAVAEYLNGKGISNNRMSCKGLGSKQPLNDNSTEEGRKINRRVEFIVKKN